MVAMVVSKVKRPDKLSDAKSAVNAAIAFFATANFARDRVTLELSIDATEFGGDFDITDSPFVRFKKIDYIRPTGYRKYLDWRDPKKVFNEGRECLDVWHQSGTEIVYRLSKLQSALRIGYFQYHAQLVEDEDEDWILDQMTQAVEDYARGRVLEDIGEMSEGDKYLKRAILFWETNKAELVEVSG